MSFCARSLSLGVFLHIRKHFNIVMKQRPTNFAFALIVRVVSIPVNVSLLLLSGIKYNYRFYNDTLRIKYGSDYEKKSKTWDGVVLLPNLETCYLSIKD